MKKKATRDCRKQEPIVRIDIKDVENLELAVEHMTEAADCISHRGRLAMNWQRAFCRGLRDQLCKPNNDSPSTERITGAT